MIAIPERVISYQLNNIVSSQEYLTNGNKRQGYIAVLIYEKYTLNASINRLT